jgi:hypothetical protein
MCCQSCFLPECAAIMFFSQNALPIMVFPRICYWGKKHDW